MKIESPKNTLLEVDKENTWKLRLYAITAMFSGLIFTIMIMNDVKEKNLIKRGEVLEIKQGTITHIIPCGGAKEDSLYYSIQDRTLRNRDGKIIARGEKRKQVSVIQQEYEKGC